MMVASSRWLLLTKLVVLKKQITNILTRYFWFVVNGRIRFNIGGTNYPASIHNLMVRFLVPISWINIESQFNLDHSKFQDKISPANL